MGYTHYFQVNDAARVAEVMPLIVADAEKIIANVEVPIANGMGDKGSSPTLTDGEIVLNGWGDDAYETFAFPDGAFCKTGERPYDLVVTAILRRVQHHAGSAVEVTSDGFMSTEYPENYQPGYYTPEQCAAHYEKDWAPADRVVKRLFETA